MMQGCGLFEARLPGFPPRQIYRERRKKLLVKVMQR